MGERDENRYDKRNDRQAVAMDETRELLQLTKEGDKEAREKLILDNMGLIGSVASRFMGRGHEMEDLYQVGSIGLMKAVDKFDLSFDVKFSTYAVPMIAGEIKRFLRDDSMVKVSRSLKETAYKVRREEERFMMHHHRQATIEELARATEIAGEEIVVALEASQEVESLYRPAYSGEDTGAVLEDRLAMPGNEPDEAVNHVLLEKLLEYLNSQEKMLIDLRYFQGKTQQEIADQMSISQVQVSRMEKKIILKMRKQMIGHFDKI